MDDKDLLILYREKGNEEYAFNLIVKKYGERLYWHIRKLVIDHDDADDLLQNSLIKIWNALPDFREESKLYTWLYRIATNEVLTFLKKKTMPEPMMVQVQVKSPARKACKTTDCSANQDILLPHFLIFLKIQYYRCLKGLVDTVEARISTSHLFSSFHSCNFSAIFLTKSTSI